MKDRYEALVVGSGFAGAVAACRLAQAGVDVAVLERGRRFAGDFPRPKWGRWDELLWHRGGPYDVKPLNDVLVVRAAGFGGGSLRAVGASSDGPAADAARAGRSSRP
jgi:cholesterol oxidase